MNGGAFPYLQKRHQPADSVKIGVFGEISLWGRIYPRVLNYRQLIAK